MTAYLSCNCCMPTAAALSNVHSHACISVLMNLQGLATSGQMQNDAHGNQLDINGQTRARMGVSYMMGSMKACTASIAGLQCQSRFALMSQLLNLNVLLRNEADILLLMRGSSDAVKRCERRPI